MIVTWVTCENSTGTTSAGGGEPDVYTDITCYEWSYDDSSGDISGGDGGYGGPSGGWGTGCQALRDNKPADCPNPIAPPAGYSYGQYSFPAGSGLAKLIALAGDPTMSRQAKILIKSALSTQTSQIADLTRPLSTVNSTFLAKVKNACKTQAGDPDNNQFGASLCADAFGKLEQEAGTPGFLDWFGGWLAMNGMDLSYSITSLQTIISVISPQNSLAIKYNKVTHDQTCSDWWTQVQVNHCGV
jgi:hypothetical protein